MITSDMTTALPLPQDFGRPFSRCHVTKNISRKGTSLMINQFVYIELADLAISYLLKCGLRIFCKTLTFRVTSFYISENIGSEKKVN